MADDAASQALVTLYTLDPFGDIDVNRFENGCHGTVLPKPHQTGKTGLTKASPRTRFMLRSHPSPNQSP
jgi:hypothetical protein